MSKNILFGNYRWLKLLAGIAVVIAAVLILMVAIDLLSGLGLPGAGGNGETESPFGCQRRIAEGPTNGLEGRIPSAGEDPAAVDGET